MYASIVWIFMTKSRRKIVKNAKLYEFAQKSLLSCLILLTISVHLYGQSKFALTFVSEQLYTLFSIFAFPV
jgi:hypothetical protein